MIELYIGPGMGIGSVILMFVIGGIIIFAFAYIIWLKTRRLFRKKKKS